MTFMQTGSGNNLNLYIYAGQTVPDPVQVKFITQDPDLQNVYPFGGSIISLTSYRPVQVQIPAQFQMSGSSVVQSTKAFYVNASRPITVMGYNEQVIEFTRHASKLMSIMTTFVYPKLSLTSPCDLASTFLNDIMYLT